MLRNTGCASVAINSASVDVYYSTNNAPGIWSSQWIGFDCDKIKTPSACIPGSTVTCGDLIGTQTNSSVIPAKGSTILTYTWSTPSNYTCGGIFNSVPNSWALLAHVNHPNDPLPSLSPSVNCDAIKSNNISRRNLVTIAIPDIGVAYFPIWMVNPFEGNPHWLEFTFTPDPNGETILQYADVYFYLQKDILDLWELGGGESINLFRINDTMVQILDRNASMLNIEIPEDQDAAIAIGFSPKDPPPFSGGDAFYVHAAQYNSWQESNVPFGGITYEIKRADWLCEGCDGDEQTLNSSFSTEANTEGSFDNQSLIIEYEMIVENGQTAEFNNSKLSFGPEGKITVNHGGKLIINNCELKSKCPKQEWPGISVTNSALAAGCLTITNSQVKGTLYPLKCENADEILIENNIFISPARQAGTAVSLQTCRSFQLTKNRFGNFETAIKSSGTYSSGSGSVIEENNVQNAVSAFTFANDDHISTNINCNRLGYAAYGIKSTATQLADFGGVTLASANRFLGNSQLQNHQISHTGNSPAFYYRTGTSAPANMSINAYTAAAGYTCASGVSARMAATRVTAIQTAISDIKVIPNPNAGVFDIEFSKLSSGKTTIYISDLQGRNVKVVRLNDGDINAKVDLSSYAKGVYFGTLVSESGEKHHVKIMAQD